MLEFGSQVYITLILILSVLLIGLLLERFQIPKKISQQLKAQTQRMQQQHKLEVDLIRKQQEKLVVALKEQAESSVLQEREGAQRAQAELEREREISRIAATVSKEQSKKIQFFTNLAHEFRNPLHEIMQSIEDLLAGNHGKLQDMTKRQLELMLRNTRLLLRGMDLFHDVSHLQLGKMEISRTQQDIVQFLREIVQTVAWYAEKKKIELRMEVATEEVNVYFDATKMAEVLYHLISNAFKFTSAGGKVLIAVSEHTTNEPEDAVQIRVRNSGEPIPEEDIPYLFDPFRRTEGNRPRFGLSLVRELISQHGGTIEVRSDPHVGTEFKIILPRGIPADAQAEIQQVKPLDLSQRAKMELSILESEDLPEDAREQKPGSISGKILIVEDNESLRELLKSGLSKHYAITEAHDGLEALEKVNTLQPDLVITDVMMPGLDGLSFCKRMKTDPATNQIPIILITAKSTESGRIEGLEAGADAYIAKPFGFEELLRKVEQLTKS